MKNFLDKIYGGIKMTWVKVLIISATVGITCGILGGLPFLSDTSFTDMAGGYEFWTVAAVIICVNCDKFWDAGLKCGTFFLITQPLMFFTQSFLFYHDMSKALMYFRLWLPMIIATYIGGMIAWLVKKDNIIGAVVMGLGNTILTALGVYYAKCFVATPPRHLIATVFSFVFVVIMTLTLEKKTVTRIIAFAVPVVLTAAVMLYCAANGLSF